MSRDKYGPQVIVIPEDQANQEMANGFLLHWALKLRTIHILRPVGGWKKVIDKFNNDYALSLSNHKERRVVLLLDLDEDRNRPGVIRADLPPDIQDRVFI